MSGQDVCPTWCVEHRPGDEITGYHPQHSGAVALVPDGLNRDVDVMLMQFGDEVSVAIDGTVFVSPHQAWALSDALLAAAAVALRSDSNAGALSANLADIVAERMRGTGIDVPTMAAVMRCSSLTLHSRLRYRSSFEALDVEPSALVLQAEARLAVSL